MARDSADQTVAGEAGAQASKAEARQSGKAAKIDIKAEGSADAAMGAEAEEGTGGAPADLEAEHGAGAEEDVKDDVAESAEGNLEESAETAGDAEAEDGEADTSERLIEEAVAAALAEQQDAMLRARAEVQNMRRRCDADMEKARKFALESFSMELLPVMDNLERALQSISEAEDEAAKALHEGVELTIKGFLETLNKFHIQQVDPAGEPFDPQQHQAMSVVENDEVEPNTVTMVVQKGYLLHGRVIRPALVMVARSSK